LASRNELSLLAVAAVALDLAAIGLSCTIAVRNGLLGIVVPATQPPSVSTRSKAAAGLPAEMALLEIARKVGARIMEGTRPLLQA
jgi:hypothetical protein